MDQVRQVLRYHHYSYRTEQTYYEWIIRFVKYHGPYEEQYHLCEGQETPPFSCGDDKDRSRPSSKSNERDPSSDGKSDVWGRFARLLASSTAWSMIRATFPVTSFSRVMVQALIFSGY